MREIKFRAWDLLGDWQKPLDVPKMVHTEDVHHAFDYFLAVHKKGQVVLMQFTGLKDKNGVEIYEGDMVRLREGVAFPVTFEDYSFGVRVDRQPTETFLIGGFWSFGALSDEDYYEVIGNIYENPEIVTG